MDAVKTIMTELAGVHTTGGLSNVSYGPPHRKIVNRCFLAMMMTHGYDFVIMNPLDKGIMALMHAADMFTGNEQSCMNYIKGGRADNIVA